MSDVKQLVTDRFLNLYGRPACADPAAFVAEYSKALGGTEAQILQAAIDIIVKRNTYRSWPTVGDCVAQVHAVAAERANRGEILERQQRQHADYYQQPTPEQRQRVDDLVKRTVAGIDEKAKKRGSKPILGAIYEEIHGRPYRAEDWAGLTEAQKQAQIREWRAYAEDRKLRGMDV